jgi:hypothetical protein
MATELVRRGLDMADGQYVKLVGIDEFGGGAKASENVPALFRLVTTVALLSGSALWGSDRFY